MFLKLYNNNSALSIESGYAAWQNTLDKGNVSIGDTFWSCSSWTLTAFHTLSLDHPTPYLHQKTARIATSHPHTCKKIRKLILRRDGFYPPSNSLCLPIDCLKTAIPMDLFERLCFQNMDAKNTSHDDLPGNEGRNLCCPLLWHCCEKYSRNSCFITMKQEFKGGGVSRQADLQLLDQDKHVHSKRKNVHWYA